MGQSFHKIDKCFDYLRIKAGSEITFRELLDYTSWSVKKFKHEHLQTHKRIFN